MNKHQEALDGIKQNFKEGFKAVCNSKFPLITLERLEAKNQKEVETLQELVDKAKPMKPEMIPYKGYLIEEATYQGCPSCKEPIHIDWKMFERNKLPKFCQECGREFDWSENE